MKKFTLCVITLVICTFISVYAGAQSALTKAQIQFTPGGGPTVPVHPDFPDVDSNEEDVEGSLAIVKVTDFHFGSIPLTINQQFYDTEDTKPHIQVVDLRGSAAGWKVSAKASGFTDGAKPTLIGSSIFIYDGRPNSLSKSAPPAQKLNTEITMDNEVVPVVEAKPGAGMGLWIMRWYPKKDTDPSLVQLSIPVGTATTGSHTASINWILEDAPEA